MIKIVRYKSAFRAALGRPVLSALLSLGVVHSAQSLTLSQTPLFLAEPVKPLVMLNMSNDHQLYFKAYDDYTDFTGDGVPDTTYVKEHEYYGYFDSDRCYLYSDGKFVPDTAADSNRHCNAGGVSNQWSGNFLNWATMTRIDTVRKILYGGYRSTDGAYDADNPGAEVETVLERAFLPHDAHSFAKYYNGKDIAKLTPFNVSGGNSQSSGITICNTTEGSGSSETVSNPPLMRVVQGNYSLWASNERWQCRWREDMSNSWEGVNGNDSSLSGISAYSDSPNETGKGAAALGNGDYNVRVKVCVAGKLEDNCVSYPSGNAKPVGLLQKYGEQGDLLFGLMTGSYEKNKSGGVLRKNIGNLADEINASTDGTFKAAPATGSIISTLNLLRITRYGYSGYDDKNGSYNDPDNCPWRMSGFSDGNCSNWGNPQSEIYLESLRYLAGASVTAAYGASDNNYIPGLGEASWVDPVPADNYCAPLNVIQFNASTSSYDGDTSGASSLSGLSDGASVDVWTNKIGAAEGINGGRFFVGENGTDNNQLCTEKTVSNLSDVKGTCPDAPRLEGNYDIAGLAYYARSNSIRSDRTGDQTVKTYGVALAPSVPKVDIPVPGNSGRIVTILPACRNTARGDFKTKDTNCAIVDFKIVSQETGGGLTRGQLYVNWEDGEQGGDFDQDMWGVIKYAVASNGAVVVATDVIAESTTQPMGFGYVISGTTSDGFHVHSGVEGFALDGCDDGGDGCQAGDGATWRGYAAGSSTASLLESPLYYAAKWGGYDETLTTEAEIAAVADPDTYFFAIDPADLEANLTAALDQVAAEIGSASSVAANSTRLGTDTAIYQALFNSGNWSGQIRAIALNADGSIGNNKWVTEDSDFASAATRKIFTYNDSTNAGVTFEWDNLSTTQQGLLKDGGTDAEGQSRLNWVRGEDVEGMRDRSSKLGDIINSSPVFASQKGHGFERLDLDLGGSSYLQYVADSKADRTEVLYVGANDGMLHAFNASDGTELFSYIPSSVYEQLKNLTQADYGSAANPHAYSVDGPIFIGDAYFDKDGDSVKEWRNVLVGTLGAGGRGIYVLDVTDPANFSASDVLFELDNANMGEIGNILGQPAIAPTNNGWKIILGNGYNSTDGEAELLVIDLENPTTASFAIPTNGSGSNGLAGPALLPNGDGEISVAYAGDLLGNMWKFDLSASNSSNWAVAYKGRGNTPAPLYTAKDASGNVQPVTAAPTLGSNSAMDPDAIMVYFGTGSYLTNADNTVGSTVHSFYAIADQGEEIDIPLGGTTLRDALYAKDISFEGDGGDGNNIRRVSNDDNTTWWTGKNGWYLDLTEDGSVTGERVISKPLLVFDRLLFPTLIPSSSPCSFGGSGWQMELRAVGDRYETHSIFGEAGQELDYAIMGYSGIITAGEKAYLPSSNIKGEPNVEAGELPSEAVGRMSWRQLR